MFKPAYRRCLYNIFWDVVDKHDRLQILKCDHYKTYGSWRIIHEAILLALTSLVFPWSSMAMLVARFTSLSLAFVYPLFKRFTYYPQVVLSSLFLIGDHC